MGMIRFIGLNNLNSMESAKVKSLAEKYGDKFERVAKNLNMVLNIKEYEKTGKRIKYAFNVKVIAPKYSVASSSASWDLIRGTHMAFKKIEHELEHKARRKRQSRSFRAKDL
jgi:ribosome-associated translation inhibitor RaiA